MSVSERSDQRLVSDRLIDQMETWSAHNYHPLPVVISEAEGSWVTDVEGRRYLDMLSAYSALNFGHRHPRLVEAAKKQLDRVTLTSRAFHNDLLGEFSEQLAKLCGMQMVLPMNTGAEAVETAVKTARRWGYDVKGVAKDKAKIVVCGGNFHARTITNISFSDDPSSYGGFGPYTPGFVQVPYGDIAALEAAIDDDTVGFLVEPIQGEAGIVVPGEGYLSAARRICTERNVLFIADEIQSGLGRTGKTFAVEHEGVKPDMFILGKALGGGIVPISAVVSSRDILGVIHAGEHGSTFGGNPLACAVGLEVLDILRGGEYQRRSAQLGAALLDRIRKDAPELVVEVRGRGLWVGVQMRAGGTKARIYCEHLMDAGVLAKDTHETTIRLAPPLSISEEDLTWGTDRLLETLSTPDLTPAG